MLMHMGRAWHEKLVDLSKDLARLEGGLGKYFFLRFTSRSTPMRKKPLPYQRQNRLRQELPLPMVQQQICCKPCPPWASFSTGRSRVSAIFSRPTLNPISNTKHCSPAQICTTSASSKNHARTLEKMSSNNGGTHIFSKHGGIAF